MLDDYILFRRGQFVLGRVSLSKADATSYSVAKCRPRDIVELSSAIDVYLFSCTDCLYSKKDSAFHLIEILWVFCGVVAIEFWRSWCCGKSGGVLIMAGS